MQRTPYDPIRELQRMESEFDMFISSDDWQHSAAGPHDASSMNLYVEDGLLVAEFAMPQFKKSEVKATVGQQMLEVTASHHESADDRRKQYLHHETSSQYFRRVSLPAEADTAHMRANFRDGLLRVTMPFQQNEKGTELTIE